MNQDELWKKVDSLIEQKKKLRADLLSIKDNLETTMIDTPLFIGYARSQIDKTLQSLDSQMNLIVVERDGLGVFVSKFEK